MLQKSHEEEKKNFLLQFEKYKEDSKANQEVLAKKYNTQVLFMTKYVTPPPHIVVYVYSFSLYLQGFRDNAITIYRKTTATTRNPERVSSTA